MSGAGARLSAGDLDKGSYGPFTITEFNERLIKFISADDQVLYILFFFFKKDLLTNETLTVNGCG